VMTRQQTAVTGLALVATIIACAASFYATTPNTLAACAIVAIAGLTVFAIAMGDDDA